MDVPLTPKQKRILDHIRTYAKARGYMPSVRDLTKLTKTAVGTVHDHLTVLKRKGWITVDGTSRGMRLVEETVNPARVVTVPIIGTIAAGAPIEAIEVREDAVSLPTSAASPGAFALRVRGDSMIEDHILDGDLVVIRQQATVNNGDVAVALLDDGTATLKRVFHEKQRVRLQPANSRLQPIYVRRLRIQGKVTAVLRVPRT